MSSSSLNGIPPCVAGGIVAGGGSDFLFVAGFMGLSADELAAGARWLGAGVAAAEGGGGATRAVDSNSDQSSLFKAAVLSLSAILPVFTAVLTLLLSPGLENDQEELVVPRSSKRFEAATYSNLPHPPVCVSFTADSRAIISGETHPLVKERRRISSISCLFHK
jgi:hypothetical protein